MPTRLSELSPDLLDLSSSNDESDAHLKYVLNEESDSDAKDDSPKKIRKTESPQKVAQEPQLVVAEPDDAIISGTRLLDRRTLTVSISPIRVNSQVITQQLDNSKTPMIEPAVNQSLSAVKNKMGVTFAADRSSEHNSSPVVNAKSRSSVKSRARISTPKPKDLSAVKRLSRSSKRVSAKNSNALRNRPSNSSAGSPIDMQTGSLGTCNSPPPGGSPPIMSEAPKTPIRRSSAINVSAKFFKSRAASTSVAVAVAANESAQLSFAKAELVNEAVTDVVGKAVDTDATMAAAQAKLKLPLRNNQRKRKSGNGF